MAQEAVAPAEARMKRLQDLTLPSAREQLSQAQATLMNARGNREGNRGEEQNSDGGQR